jgi:hypothetical protein
MARLPVSRQRLEADLVVFDLTASAAPGMAGAVGLRRFPYEPPSRPGK